MPHPDKEPSPTPGALHGIRVLDLSSVIFGPYASLVLADYGAEVIKIEPPQGDSTRYTGPRVEDGLAAMFISVNRNKKSVALDLKQPAAREALLQLVDGADVFMHSIRPQKMQALGLDPSALRQRNPRLVYAALLGFGSGGAYSGKPAYDDIVQGLSGIADLMQRQSGEPRYYPSIAADKTSGLIAAHAILAALFQRSTTGSGQTVEVPMFESMVSYNLIEHYYGRHFADAPSDSFYPRLMSASRKPYQSADGYICMMPYTDAHWRHFFIHSGHPGHAEDPRFASIATRTSHIDTLYALAQEIVRERTTEDWLQLLNTIEIPACRVNALDELEHDPHLQDVGLFEDVHDDAQQQRYRFIRNPVQLEHSPSHVAMPPRLGEHTKQVLAQAGLSPQTIDALLASGAAVASNCPTPTPKETA